jgi:Na+:H+ antiporter
MANDIVFILLFIVATAVAIIARRVRVPYTVALVLAGLTLGALHAFEPPHLTRELLFFLCLPGLLFEAAFHMDAAQFWRNRLATLSLAVPGVAAAVAITALILAPVVEHLNLASGFSWQHALVFGAMLAATDPIAVVALFRSMGAPARLTILLEGESLLNDGTSIVFFSLVLGLVTGGGDLTVRGLTFDFATSVGVGLMIGAAIGVAVSEILKQIDDPMIEITLTTIAAYGSFVTAEHLHYSGVIATVAAGMLCGNYGARVGMSPATRIAVETFWEYIAFALNSVVFLLIGFEVQIGALLDSWRAIVAAYLAVVLARAAVIAVASVLLLPTRERIPPSWSVVLAWGGLRGALSMVLALSLPMDFPHRELLITMTFGVVIVSLLVQGLTMGVVLRWLGVVSGAKHRMLYELNRGQRHAATAAQDELERIAHTRYVDADALEAIREHYRQRIEAAEQRLRDLPIDERELQREERHWLRRRLLLVEKDRIIELLRQGVLGQDTYERLSADIDGRLLDLDVPSADDAAPETPPAGGKPSDKPAE